VRIFALILFFIPSGWTMAGSLAYNRRLIHRVCNVTR
jgi:hypothetical protein